MRRKKSILALSAITALASLGAYASGELMRIGSIAKGEGHAEMIAYVSEQEETYTIPFEFTPTRDQYDQCIRVDNNTGKTWQYDFSEKAFSITYATPLDNWIILPGVQIAAGDYKFSCEYKTRYMTEDFQVYLLSSEDVSSVVTTLLDIKDFGNDSAYTKGEKAFSVSADGVYHLAIHASSNDKFGIFVRNLAINSASTAQPASPFLVNYTLNGLEGRFNVELPSKTMGDTPLSGNVNLDMKVDGNHVKTASGEASTIVPLEYTFTGGNHEVSFVAWVQNGDKQESSDPIKISVETHELAPEQLEIPFTITPTEDEFRWCTVINANNDGQTWTYKTSGTPGDEPCFAYRYDSAYPADDWFVLPLIDFYDTGMYELTFDLATHMRAETLEVSLADDLNSIGYSESKIAVYTEFSTGREWQQKKVNLTINATGKKYLAFHAASPRNRDYLYVKNISIKHGENNTPLLPSIAEINLDGGDGTISARMPQESYSGHPLTGEVTAHFSIDEGAEQTVVSAPGELAVLNVSGLSKGNHTVSVYASIEDEGLTLKSDPVSKQFMVITSSSFRYTLPLALNLGENFADFTVMDINNDGFTWIRNGNAIEYPYCALNKADDWLFTRFVNITEENAAQILRIAVDAKAAYSLSSEGFEVWIGSAANPEDMTRKLISVEGINNTSYVNFCNEFAVENAGDYVIGIHAVSPAESGYLYLENLTLEATSRSSEVPAEVENIYAEADQTGALKATVYFTFPTKTARGNEMDVNSNLALTATCGTATATATGKPGESTSVEIDTAEGENTISLCCSNANGAGLVAQANVECGLDIPSTPRILSTEVSEDNYSVSIRWRAVTTGENDGIVNAPAMRYRVYVYNPVSEIWAEVEDTDKLSYTFSVPAEMDYQDSFDFAVEAYNAPESVSLSRSLTSAVLGKPYQLPMNETFEDEMLHYGPVSLFSTLQGRYAPSWYLGDPAQLNPSAVTADGYAMIGHTEYTSGDTQVELPKFSSLLISDKEGYTVTGFTLSMRIYFYEHTPSMKFIGLCYGNENSPIEIGEIDTSMGSGWVDVTYTLPDELNDKQWVAIRDMVEFTEGSLSWALIDSYSISKIETLGVETVASGRSVVASTGAVTLRGFAGTEVTIADISGKVVASRTVSSDQWTLALPAGIYVVNTCDGAHKVIVK